MQRRKRWLSIILMLTAFISVLFCTGMNVCAEAVTDGISVSVSSDKAEYDSDDEVKLEITVKNANDFEVSNLRIENILPDGIKLVSGNAVEENVTLKAEEEKIVNLSVAKANDTTINTSTLPKTGESNIIPILLVVLITSAIIIGCVLKKKGGFKFLSIVLCVCLVGKFASASIVNAENSNSNDESISRITAECHYKIDGVKYIHKVIVSSGELPDLKSGNLNQVQEYLDTFYDIKHIDKDSTGYLLNDKVYIEVKDITVNSDGTTGKAKVVVKAPDLAEVVATAVENVENIEELSNKEQNEKTKENMRNALKNKEYSEVETELEVEIQKIAGKWKYIYSDEFGKAISCNINELFRNSVKEMFGSVKND